VLFFYTVVILTCLAWKIKLACFALLMAGVTIWILRWGCDVVFTSSCVFKPVAGCAERSPFPARQEADSRVAGRACTLFAVWLGVR